MSEARQVISPRTRPLPRFPRWAPPLLLVGVIFETAAAATRFEAFAVGAAGGGLLAAVSGAVIAAWLERRLYALLLHTPGALRLCASAVLPAIALVAGPVLGGVLAASLASFHVAGTVGSAWGVGVMWFAGAALGSLAVVLIDTVVSALIATFRNRIVLAVLMLLGGVVTLAVVATFGVFRLLRRVRAADSDELHEMIPGFLDPGFALDVARWVEGRPNATAAVIIVVVMAVGFPAGLSACGKLADAVSERIGPLSHAFDLVAAGARDVALEEGGSKDLVEMIRHFNQMVLSLRLAERMERAFGAYVSKTVMERIKQQHGEATLPASLKEATVFFADIRGFTSMSERLSPDVVVAVLNRYFERVIDLIERHEGYLDKFIGDAVVVVFNGPIDQPDHAPRATRCAIDLQRAVEEMNQEGAFPEIGELAVGIGVATGQMVCGNIGSTRQMEYTVIGDTVNLSARLTNHAPAGEVWVSEGTARLLAPELAKTALEPLTVKGKEAAVVPYRVWPAPAATIET